MRRIVYHTADGNTCIVHPILNIIGEIEGFTDAQAEQRAFDKLPPEALEPHFVAFNQLPQDRTFRNALKPDLSFDMDKAKEIHKEALRKIRKPLLEDLDIQARIFRNDKTELDKIETKAQALRDVTSDPAFDLAQTTEDLKRIMPEVLK